MKSSGRLQDKNTDEEGKCGKSDENKKRGCMICKNNFEVLANIESMCQSCIIGESLYTDVPKTNLLKKFIKDEINKNLTTQELKTIRLIEKSNGFFSTQPGTFVLLIVFVIVVAVVNICIK